MNLKELSLDELKELRASITAEITEREKDQLVLYTHGCKSSSDYHLRRDKHWAKVIKSVDTAETTGYAFQGDFLQPRREHKLPTGSIIVEVCNTKITGYQLTDTGKQEIASALTSSMSGFIDEIAKYV